MRSLFVVAIAATATALPRLQTRATDFCKNQDFTIDAWKDNDMDNFVRIEGIDKIYPTLTNTTLMDAWSAKLPGWTPTKWHCNGDSTSDDCSASALLQFCSGNPKWTFVLASLGTYIQYMLYVQRSVNSMIATVSMEYPKFPATFYPDSVLKPPKGDTANGAAIAGNVLSFMSAIMSVIPGVGAVKSVTGVVKSTITVVNAGLAASSDAISKDEGKLDLQFASFAEISDGLATIKKAMDNAVKQKIDTVVANIPKAQSDINWVWENLQGGPFAGQIKPKSQIENDKTLHATMAAPGINTLWNYAGVVIAKCNKKDFEKLGYSDLDVCSGDTLFKKGTKYCDKDGSMFVLQKLPKDKWDIQNQGTYDVPGINDLDKYGLSPEIVMKSAWRNQKLYGIGGAGPSPNQLIDTIKGSTTTDIPRENLAFFNTPVCDFASIPVDASQKLFAKGACDKGDKQTKDVCYFYTMMLHCKDIPDFNKGNVKWPFNG
ncbi:hypothetical protein AMS68_007828 [Peltaster fructicola]|uniref:DUF7872 domain-containing protein n=1 Tax=Peltaster fructicola TaxID=286661 RepID=A0A6H0Y5V2_9PEZI|nr:hypothetical protein AMS68_007828 [Peltaster fructicola]